MNDYAIFLTHRVDCIAGKPPPTKKRFHSADYVLFDKRRLAARQRYSEDLVGPPPARMEIGAAYRAAATISAFISATAALKPTNSACATSAWPMFSSLIPLIAAIGSTL